MALKNISFAMHRADFNRLMDEHRRAATTERAQQIEQTIWEFVEFASRIWELEHTPGAKERLAARAPQKE